MEVTSEILPFFERDAESKPLINMKSMSDVSDVVSKFSIAYPDTEELDEEIIKRNSEKDSDGDYIVRRRHDKTEGSCKEITIFLEHGVSTELKLVGLQIWRGALLLADYLIHTRGEIRDKTVLEVGAGVGLTSVVAGMFAKQIVCTDIDRGDLLNLLTSNMERNKELIKAMVFVREIDFFNLEWTSDVRDKMNEVSVVVAADVIYDNDVTEAFFKTITKILNTPPKKTLYLAMEKRYVFTVADLDCVAPCYEHMLSCLEETRRTEPFSRWEVEEIPLDFPQYFNYERVKELIMFKISS